MRKPGKSLVAVGLLLALVIGFAAFVSPSEPHFKGRSLSAWLMIYYESDGRSRQRAQREPAAEAIRALGTNSLPYLLKSMRYETAAWQTGINRIFPRRILLVIGNSRPARATVYRAYHRAEAARTAFRLLGTNAASAIPDLECLMQDRSHPDTARRAMDVLGHMGHPGLHALESALANTNQLWRESIAWYIAYMTKNTADTNRSLAALRVALDDPDPKVRAMASNLVAHLSGKQPANTPPQY